MLNTKDQRRMAALDSALFDALPSQAAYLDEDGIIVAVNRRWREFAQANHLVLSGFGVGVSYPGICEAVSGEGQEQAHAAALGIRMVLEGIQPEFELEYPCHSPDLPRWYRLTVTPVTDGLCRCAVVMHVDISQRRHAEKAEQRQAQRLTFLVQAQRELAQSDAPLDQLVDLVPELALRIVGGLAAMFDILEDDAMVCRAGTTEAATAIGMRIPIVEGFSGEAIRQNRTLRCDDTKTDPRVAAAACSEYGLRSVLVAVVRDRAGPIGVLKVVAREPFRFTDADANSLELLADALGALFQRRRAKAEAEESLRLQRGIVRIQQEIGSLQGEPQSVLRSLAVRVQALTEASGAMIEMIEGDEIVICSAAGCFGDRLGARMPVGMSVAALTIANAAPLRCDDSEADARDIRTVCREVGARSILTSPFKLQGLVVGVLTVVAEPTNAFSSQGAGSLSILTEWLGVVLQRSADAKELHDSERQYRLVFTGNPLPMWILDVESGSFLAVNDAAIAHYGYSRAEFLTMTFADLLPEAQVALSEQPTKINASRHRTRAGTILDVELSSNDIHFGERPAKLVLAHNITERKRAELQMQKDKTILAIAGRIAQVAGWSFELTTRSFSYSNELCALQDMAAGELLSLKQALNFYAPESRPAMVQAVNDCARDGTPYDLELEIVTRKGRRIGVRTIGQAVRDDSGVIIGTQGALQDITEQLEARAKQAARDLRFDTALNNISQGVCFFDKQQCLIVANARFADMYRVPRGDVRQGRTLREIVAMRVRAGTGPETTCDEYLDWRDSILALNVASDTLTKLADGRTFAIHHQPTADGGWVATHDDITERIATQESLRALNESLEAKVIERTSQLELTHSELASKEEEIRSVVEHMADAVITLSDDGIIRSANPMVESIFGYRPEALIGTNVTTLIPAFADIRPDSAGASSTRVSSGLHRNGDVVTLEISIGQYSLQGQSLQTAILRDIGERIAIMADLENARLGAEQASRAKSNFVATMSHEIRTPMNGVIGMLDVLEQTALAPDQIGMLGLASESAHSLMGIIEEILDFSKIEAGKIVIERNPLLVRSVIENACASITGVALNKNVELYSIVDVAVPSAILGDALRLRQVLVNLIANAVKFSSGRRTRGKVDISVVASDVSLDRVVLNISVRDNGIGMDAQTIASLFKPFVQADATTTRRFGGTGLGLAISHNLVHLMGGEIVVSSTPGVCSSFTVRLPVDIAPLSDAINVMQSSASLLKRPLQMPERNDWLILVAEDNETNQHVIKAQLRLLGLNAELVGNGYDALASWRSGRFTLLLTDLQMPGMDGYSLAARIRAEENEGMRIPIIALTADALKDQRERCEAVGMDDYLTKPVPLQILGRVLTRWACQSTKTIAMSQPVALRDRVPVDASVLPLLIGDDSEALSKFFDHFSAVALEAATALQLAMEESRMDEAASVAHRLKSSARAIGALHLGNLCARVEASATSPSGAPVPHWQELRNEVDAVRSWIAHRHVDLGVDGY